jgi:hypothetical protein
MMSNLYYDAEIGLAGGRVIRVNEGSMYILWKDDGQGVFFDGIVN